MLHPRGSQGSVAGLLLAQRRLRDTRSIAGSEEPLSKFSPDRCPSPPVFVLWTSNGPEQASPRGDKVPSPPDT